MAGNSEEQLKSPSPIISGVLCYASTARHALRNDDIIRVCLAFYSDEEIIRGKDILCDLIGEKSKRRRNENRIMHEAKDILDILRKCDDNKLKLPKFVVDTYDGLPPTSGFELIAQTLTSLNDEIVSLKSEIENLKDSRIEQGIVSQDMAMMKEDLITIKGELRKINHSVLKDDIRRDSLLLGNLHSIRRMNEYLDEDKSTTETETNNGKHSAASECNRSLGRSSIAVSPSAPSLKSDDLIDVANRSIQDIGGSPSAPTFSQVVGKNIRKDDSMNIHKIATENITKLPVPKFPNSVNAHRKRAYDKPSATVDEDGFTLVQKAKKTRGNIVGSKKYLGDRNIKSARNMVDIYLGNLDLDVTEDEIINYIKDETGITVYKCMNLMSKNPNCKAFKISVGTESRIALLSPEIWPEGVICRKFYNPRNKYINNSE